MITSIQIHERIKKALDNLKESNKESYEDVICKLMHTAEEQRRKKETLLIEGCKEMAGDSLRITKEWETTDSAIDWEWNDENKKG